jgi:hypothetical protein
VSRHPGLDALAAAPPSSGDFSITSISLDDSEDDDEHNSEEFGHLTAMNMLQGTEPLEPRRCSTAPQRTSSFPYTTADDEESSRRQSSNFASIHQSKYPMPTSWLTTAGTPAHLTLLEFVHLIILCPTRIEEGKHTTAVAKITVAETKGQARWATSPRAKMTVGQDTRARYCRLGYLI